MTEDTPLPFDLPAVSRKKVTADFAGRSISSDGGLVLLRRAERRLRLAETLAGCIREWRDPARTVHTLPAMLRFRMFAIACGYEDADALRQAQERHAARRSAVQAGGRPGAGEWPRSLFPAHHEPDRERALAQAGGAHDGRAGRHLLPLLPDPADGDHARHRRYLRPGSRPPAALAVQRALRHEVLSPGPRLPCRERQAGGGPPAPRQDAVRRRGPHPDQAPGRAHPPALAAHPADLPRRQPLRPPRGDGLVRGQRRRLHLRPGRQRRAARAGLQDRRRSQGAPRRGRGGADARLRQLRLRRRLVEP